MKATPSIPKIRSAFLVILAGFGTVPLLAQTGPAGVGTNAASATQNRFWLKADASVYNNAGTTLAASGDMVQQWNDVSGVGNNAVQATAANRPRYITNVINGFPALRFLGNYYITASGVPSIPNNTGYSYLVVFKDTAFTAGAMGDGAGSYIIDRGPPSTEGNELASLKITNTNKYGFQKRDGAGGGIGGPVSAVNVSNGLFRIASYREAPGATKTYNLFVDGNLEATVTNADANYSPQTPQIGRHYSGANNGLKGFLTEVIIYNYNVNDAQMNILNNYLASKYGLGLVSNDKYAGDTPVNGNYDFEVAGVGQEASGNNASAASSISGGLDVTQATAMENGEYLLFGHQTGANILNTTDVGGMSVGPANARWGRIWYFDWTHVGGTNESVNLTFDFSDSGTGGAAAGPTSNYKLLYRAGLAGAWTEVMSATSFAGDRITFNGVIYNTAGDGYYTVGSLDYATSPLPLELISFKASVCESAVCLRWITATEKNTDKFIVQRSSDGVSWKEIATVKAANNSQQVLYYSAKDNYPNNGISYYQLKALDLDQTFDFSPIVSVDNSHDEGVRLLVYPNPSDGNIQVEIVSEGINQKAHLLIIDAAGSTVREFPDIIFNDKTIFDIPMKPALSAGIYQFVLTVGDQTRSVKLVLR
ncbi:MAG: T9SS type A sorting domain-containing protein [bacterium]|nr:T9SS type A sorting domain-containing protein [bacterium]